MALCFLHIGQCSPIQTPPIVVPTPTPLPTTTPGGPTAIPTFTPGGAIPTSTAVPTATNSFTPTNTPLPTNTPPGTTPTPTPTVQSNISGLFANSGEDKVTNDELRATQGQTVSNAVWNNAQVTVWGALNETVSFNTILETISGAPAVNVTISNLVNGVNTLTTRAATSNNDVFNYTGRNIEQFYVKFLQIKGISRGFYQDYDQLQIPTKMQLPCVVNSNGNCPATAGFVFTNRPNANKFYPEIAQPIETLTNHVFTIPANSNAQVWTDIYIPKTQPAGSYSGTLSVTENSVITKTIPIVLIVHGFTLPDSPSFPTMIYLGGPDINRRFSGVANGYPSPDTAYQPIRLEYKQLLHRHHLMPIDDGYTLNTSPNGTTAPTPEDVLGLNGSLYGSAYNYDGYGKSQGDPVYAIGAYGSFNFGTTQASFQTNADAWESWFRINAPTATRFVYLADEISGSTTPNYTTVDQWASWITSSAGIGSTLNRFLTNPFPGSPTNVPHVNILGATFTGGVTTTWQTGFNSYGTVAGNQAWMYNGGRPWQGSLAIEDEGVSPRELFWGLIKKGVQRYFYWDADYYQNYQYALGNTDVFNNAQTFGGSPVYDNIRGFTASNYDNGSGVLAYPGTDLIFPNSSLGLAGPLASLRLKHLRRGLEDADYIALAKLKNAASTNTLIASQVPTALWDYGVFDPADPTYQYTGISWNTNPDTWDSARAQLATIIEAGGVNTPAPTPTNTPGGPTPTATNTPPPAPTLTPTPGATATPFGGALNPNIYYTGGTTTFVHDFTVPNSILDGNGNATVTNGQNIATVNSSIVGNTLSLNNTVAAKQPTLLTFSQNNFQGGKFKSANSTFLNLLNASTAIKNTNAVSYVAIFKFDATGTCKLFQIYDNTFTNSRFKVSIFGNAPGMNTVSTDGVADTNITASQTLSTTVAHVLLAEYNASAATCKIQLDNAVTSVNNSACGVTAGLIANTQGQGPDVGEGCNITMYRDWVESGALMTSVQATQMFADMKAKFNLTAY